MFSIMGTHLRKTSNYMCTYAQREAWKLWLPGVRGRGLRSDFPFFLCFSVSFECSVMNMYYLSKQKIHKKP